MIFDDRIQAGKRLADALKQYRNANAVVLALPRGGVPVGAEVANSLNLSLDLLLVRKIGVPWQQEVAMGAVIDGGHPIIERNEDVLRLTGITRDEFDWVCQKELTEIERRRARYLGGRNPLNVRGKVAIIVDDGIATGATVRVAIQGLRRREPAMIVLAVPVAPPDTVSELRQEADEVVCLEQPQPFEAISLYYASFPQLDDETVIEILARTNASTKTVSH